MPRFLPGISMVCQAHPKWLLFIKLRSHIHLEGSEGSDSRARMPCRYCWWHLLLAIAKILSANEANERASWIIIQSSSCAGSSRLLDKTRTVRQKAVAATLSLASAAASEPSDGAVPAVTSMRHAMSEDIILNAERLLMAKDHFQEQVCAFAVTDMTTFRLYKVDSDDMMHQYAWKRMLACDVENQSR